MSEPQYQFYDRKPERGSMRDEVLDGLRSEPKALSPKYFYDAEGSALFEAITELPEYYLTRTELSLFDSQAASIAAAVDEGGCIVEYGSGSNLKIRKLLETTRPAAYVPVDISSEHLQDNARELQRDFPMLAVYPVCADITRPFALPEEVAWLTKIGFFPGSSIGNFDPPGAVQLLETIRSTLGPAQYLLLGVDRKKDPAVLERAYDDAAGVTARFNLNVLRHVNERLDADFQLDQFRHVAQYNADIGAVQMFLESTVAQRVRIGDATIEFARGERVHTENSFKYEPEEFETLAAQAGYASRALWTDPAEYYALFLLQGVASVG
ncbi:MAG: L-histidine N(alpha)-methyltransferase [Pseudomonadota bacterium]